MVSVNVESIMNILNIIADMFVGFSSREYTGTETTGLATVCVRVLNPPFGGAIRPFSVSLLPEEGSYLASTVMISLMSIFQRKGIFI